MGYSIDPLLNDDEPVSETKQMPRIVIWMLVFSLLALLAPLFLISTTIKDNNQQIKSEISQIDQALESLSQPKPEQEELQNTLLDMRMQLEELQLAQDEIMAQHINWPAVIRVIGNYGSAQIKFTNLSQTLNQIIINGQADSEVVIMTFARMLEQSGLFSRVVVQSIAQKTLPTPLPSTADANSTPEALRTPTQTIPAQTIEFMILVELKPAEVANE